MLLNTYLRRARISLDDKGMDVNCLAKLYSNIISTIWIAAGGINSSVMVWGFLNMDIWYVCLSEASAFVYRYRF